MDMMQIGAKIGVYYVPFLFALCFHEYAHAWLAKKRGDNTAQMMGRLTMNPVSHMDMLGTVILPVMAILFNSPVFFGWAKPVPVNPRNLKSPRKDMFWVALAGPLSNVLLAFIGAALIWLLVNFFAFTSVIQSSVQVLVVFITTNLFLAVFNMIPLNPLDGGKVLARFLPHHMNQKLEQNEHITSLVLMALVLTGALSILAVPVKWGVQLLIAGAGLGGIS